MLHCGVKSKVIDTRGHEYYIRRRYECSQCSTRYTTKEFTNREFERIDVLIAEIRSNLFTIIQIMRT